MMNLLPLAGLSVVEFAGLAPGPFAGLILADWGASVVRVDRPASSSSAKVTEDYLARNKCSIAIDPKVPSGLDVLKELVNRADVLIDPFRPGVMERLGLGPDVFLGKNGTNKRLVYARLVGFSRTGPHKDLAGHDLNYLAVSGILSLLPGLPNKPSFPLNLLADFAGGGLLCALGILVALFERERHGAHGLGQVVETDMVSGTRYLSTFPLLHSFACTPTSEITSSGTSYPPSAPSNPSSRSAESVSDKPIPLSTSINMFAPANAHPSTRMRGTLDDGAPFYSIYTCADGRWMSVGCLEPKFFGIFLDKLLGALPKEFIARSKWIPTAEVQFSKDQWPMMKNFFMQGFALYGRDYWEDVFKGTDACALPVLSPIEAAALASTSASPEPHPNLSRTPALPLPARSSPSSIIPHLLLPGEHTDEILSGLGLTTEEKRKLVEDGALGRVVRDSKL